MPPKAHRYPAFLPPRIREGLTLGAFALMLAILTLMVAAAPSACPLPLSLDRLEFLQALLAVLVTGAGFTVYSWTRWRGSQRELEIAKQTNVAIAARLEAERALRESQDRFQALANATFEGLLIHDQGIVLDVNEAFTNLAGLTREDMLGKSILTFFPESLQGQLRERIRRPLASGTETASPYEIEVPTPAGEVLHLEVRVKAMPYQGRIVRVAAFQNITERRRLERAKSELISVVSHELRSPLGSLHNSLELLANGVAGPLPERAQRMAEIALNSAGRLIRLTNQTLEYEQLSNGRLALNLSACTAAGLLQQAADTLRGLADSRDITLSVEAEPFPLHADADRIIQVLVNFLSNALKFAPPGSTVRLRSHRMEDEDRFEVRDEGPGIPADQVDAIFERFVQLEPAPHCPQRGIGLGLAISRDLIALHGGRIGVESPPGEGSTFFFTLPRDEKGAP